MTVDQATGERVRRTWTNSARRPYVARYLPGHVLADGKGRALAHRVSLHTKLGGRDAPCTWCQKPLTWQVKPPSSELVDGRAALTVDHLNGDVTDNRAGNLVPACLACNSKRRVKPRVPPKGGTR